MTELEIHITNELIRRIRARFAITMLTQITRQEFDAIVASLEKAIADEKLAKPALDVKDA